MEERNLHTPLSERTLYTLEVESGLGNSIFSNAISFHDWQHSLRRELPGESKALRLLVWVFTVSWEWTGKRDRRQEEPEEQGCTQHPSSFLDLHSLSAAESESPIQSFLHKTNQSIICIHITNNSAPLQGMHRESHQLHAHWFLLFQRKSARIPVSTQNPPLEAGDLGLSLTTEHSTLQSWRDWEAGLLGHRLGFLLSHRASAWKSNSGHCLWLLCCVEWAEVLRREGWVWSWSLLSWEHCIRSPC